MRYLTKKFAQSLVKLTRYKKMKHKNLVFKKSSQNINLFEMKAYFFDPRVKICFGKRIQNPFAESSQSVKSRFRYSFDKHFHGSHH